MEESTKGKETVSIKLSDKNGNVWITDMRFLKVGQPTEMGTLKSLARSSRLCGCGDVCLAVVDLPEE